MANSQASKKHAHIIGICGKATSALALALANAGWKVTGSDKGFYPPASDLLTEAGIKFYPGWHPEKMGKPDIVIPISYAGENNPEWQYAKDNNIPLVPYTQVFRDYFIKPKSLVVAGTWGKTSSTALLAHIFTQAKLDPSYMMGGIPKSGERPAHIGNGEWSVFEGDEYRSERDDPTPKFVYYNPTHLLLTGLSWDHADLYPTEDHYFAVFEKLVSSIPPTGLIVACDNDTGVKRVLGGALAKVVTYGRQSSADYQYVRVGQSSTGLRFGIKDKTNSYAIESGLIGDFQAENITGAFAIALELGIPAKSIIASIRSFAGLRQRLEKVCQTKSTTVINDLAHSPDKARATLRNLREIYSGKIVAVFEPNLGGRNAEMASRYTGAFSAADSVIIPRLSKQKIDPDRTAKPMDGADLAKLISRAHLDVRYIPDDDKLVEQLATEAPMVIVFLGSHGFRGMIEATCLRLQSQP